MAKNIGGLDMKRGLHLLPMLFLIFGVFFSSSGQAQDLCSVHGTWYTENAPNTGGEGGFTSYRTFGPPDVDYVDWKDHQWQRRVGANWVISAAPPTSSNGKIYIEISCPHKVKTLNPLDYKNKTRLIICGDLQVGTLDLTNTVPFIYNVTISLDNYNLLFSAKYNCLAINVN